MPSDPLVFLYVLALFQRSAQPTDCLLSTFFARKDKSRARITLLHDILHDLHEMSTGTVTAPPASPSLTSPTGPRPLQLLDSNIPSALNSPVSALTSPHSSALGLSTPPPSARTFKQGNPRRQSSISYFPSDYVRSPSVRSPTTPSSPFSKPSPRRTASVGVWDDDVAGAFSTIKRDRRSMGALIGSRENPPSSPVVDHGPLTLTEK